MITPERRLARLALATDPRFLRAASAFVREMAAAAGLGEAAAANLELATEEAGLLVIDQAFEGTPGGSFDICCEYGDGRFILAFEDKGLPFEWSKAAQSETSRHSIALLTGFADELRMVNRGKAGKRLEFVVNQAGAYLELPHQDGAGGDGDESVAMAPLDVPLELRPTDPLRDGVGFARCMYKVYGYSYVETVYFPERIQGLIEQGLLLSFVAVTPEGEVAGHQGVKRDSPSARVANICMGAVDPRYRGRRLFERLKAMAVESLREKGLLGAHVEAVALHPFSQKANFKTGGRETGMLLAHVPRSIDFRNIKDGEASDEVRQSAVLYYNAINKAPHRTVHLPPHHHDMAARIYAWAGVDRSVVAPSSPGTLPPAGQVDVEVAAAVGFAFISIAAPGEDMGERVKAQLDELKLARIDIIYLDVPLSEAWATAAIGRFEALGFSFCGIYPEKHESGDLLRLHYLNNLRVDPAQIVTINEMGAAILDYTLAEMKRVSLR